MTRELNNEGINEISSSLGLPIKKIFDLLCYLNSIGKTENRMLVRKLGVSKNVLNQVKRELAAFLEPVSDKTALNHKGIKLADKVAGSSYQTEESLWEKFDHDEQTKNIVNLLNKYSNLRPKPERKWDQFTATAVTTARRVVLMDFFEDIRGKRILCLGDDDLVSVAVASIIRKANKVSVLDIDKKLLGLIENIAKKEKLEITTQTYDARETLPKDYIGNFDVVFTDPPYTESGIKLFLSRAVQALDPKNNSGRIYLCYGNSDRAKERFLPIYKLLADSGLMIRWVFDKFNRYHGAESIGSASSLFICDVTPRSKLLINGYNNESIYTNN